LICLWALEVIGDLDLDLPRTTIGLGLLLRPLLALGLGLLDLASLFLEIGLLDFFVL
jgi:hypothetical protein